MHFLVITGIGTMTQAIAAGAPQLIVPFFFDQPDNAARAEKLGLAITVHIKKYSPKAAERCLNELLRSAQIKKAVFCTLKKLTFNNQKKIYIC